MPGKPKPYNELSERTKERARERRMERYYERKAAGICPQCGQRPASPGKAWCDECRSKGNRRTKTYPVEMQRKWDKSARIRLQEAAIAAYGGVCACCGEDYMPFLELDHINGNGKEHRAAVGGLGTVFFSRLKRLGFPTDAGLQVLCANCHRAKTRNLSCPASHHQRVVRTDPPTRVLTPRAYTDNIHGTGPVLAALPKLAKSPVPEKQCLQCGRQIVRGSPGEVLAAKFCGRECGFTYRRSHPTKPPKEMGEADCVRCGKRFSYYIKNNAGKYCSTDCFRQRFR